MITTKVKSHLRNGRKVIQHSRKLEGRMTPEHLNKYNQLKNHRDRMRGMHPGDDMPFQQYDGYNVRDARVQISNKLKALKDMYQTPEEKKAGEESANKRYIAERKKRYQNNAPKRAYMKAYKSLMKTDSKFKGADQIKAEYSYHSSTSREYKKSRQGEHKKLIGGLLAKHGFKSINEAMKYHAANKPK